MEKSNLFKDDIELLNDLKKNCQQINLINWPIKHTISSVNKMRDNHTNKTNELNNSRIFFLDF